MHFMQNSLFVRAYWLVTAATFVAAGSMIVFYAPNEVTMGIIQKIFYIHLPAAILTLFASLITFGASIAYITFRRSWLDDLGAAGARITVQFCAIVLITGMIWGRSAWGQWWTWSPRLTFTLLMFLLYLVYLVLRTSIESKQRRSIACAVYGIIAFLDVPLVYLSVKLMPDIHPSHIELARPMQITLLASAIPMLLMCAGLIATRYTLNSRARELETETVDEHAMVGAMPRLGGLS